MSPFLLSRNPSSGLSSSPPGSPYRENLVFTLPPFEYEELWPGNLSIRLVRLIKGPRARKDGSGEPIRCRIQLAYLDDKDLPKYDAVSYVWGMEERTCTIELSGQSFKVSPTVEDILLRLRDDKRDRHLWLDQICIDQGNSESARTDQARADRATAEKAIQVGRMKDIFGKARTVIVSLGPHFAAPVAASPNGIPHRYSDSSGYGSRRASMQTIPNAHDSQHQAMSLIKPMHGGGLAGQYISTEDQQSLLDFLNLPWFERVWVVQEVAVARKLLFVCGSREMDGSYLGKLRSHLGPRIDDPLLKAKINRIFPLLEYIAQPSSAHSNKPELLSLLQRFRNWKSTLPQDKVFALLNLSNDGPYATDLVPNYTISVDELYERVAKYMVLRYKSPSILSYVGRVSTLSMPTWCPDWRVEWPVDYCEPPSTPSRRPSTQDVDELGARSGTLVAKGFIIGSVMSAARDYTDVALTPDVLNYCHDLQKIRISNHLMHLRVNMGCQIQNGDLICVLDGSCGMRILRPQDENHEVVTSVYMGFPRVRVDGAGPAVSVNKPNNDTIYGQVIRMLMDVRAKEGPRTSASVKTFRIM